MGYYTTYSLQVRDKSDYYEAQMSEAGEWNDEAFIASFLQYGDPFCQECKWYTNEADMKQISLKFPNVLFILSGEGEESGDLWVAYHKNGKVQREKAQITFSPFDEEKLK